MTKSVWGLRHYKRMVDLPTRALKTATGKEEEATWTTGCDKIGVTVDIVTRLCYYFRPVVIKYPSSTPVPIAAAQGGFSFTNMANLAF